MIFLITYSMAFETALTFTHGHFNRVVFAVHVVKRWAFARGSTTASHDPRQVLQSIVKSAFCLSAVKADHCFDILRN